MIIEKTWQLILLMDKIVTRQFQRFVQRDIALIFFVNDNCNNINFGNEEDRQHASFRSLANNCKIDFL